MENKYTREYPVKVEQIKNGFTLNYNIREVSESELLELWEGSGRAELEGSLPSADFVAEHKYAYNAVTVPMGQWNYGGIVSAIIREKYKVDEMESITNNVTAVVSEFFEILVLDGIIQATRFLSESFKEGLNTTDFNAMQEWRAMAKREAKSVLKNG